MVSNISVKVMTAKSYKHRWSAFDRKANSCYLRATYAASRYCFWWRLYVCATVSVRTKCRKLLIRNWCNFVEICPMVNAGSDLKLVTFDLESYFLTFSIQTTCFEWLDLTTSFSVWRYIFRTSRLWFCFKVIGPRSRSQQRKAVAYNLKLLVGNCWGYICYDKARSNLELLTFWPWPLTLRQVCAPLDTVLFFLFRLIAGRR